MSEKDQVDQKGGRLSWQLPLRLPEEWRGPMQQIADEMSTPTRRKLSLADVVREAIYRLLVAEGKVQDRRRDSSDAHD